MLQNPRIGLILMRDDWKNCREAQAVRNDIQADTQVMMKRLKQHYDLQGPWVVDSQASLAACAAEIRSTEPDMIVLAYQTWSDGANLVSLLPELGGCPLVLWCYLPWRRFPRPATQAEMLRGSGPVGTFGALGILRNRDTPFLFTFGAPDDPRLITDLRVAGRAAQVRRMLQFTRFGLLPGQSDSAQGTYVDMNRLKEQLGPAIQSLTVDDLLREVNALDAARVDAYVSHLRERFQIENVSDDTLILAARAALGLLDLAESHGLDVMAVHTADTELGKAVGLRPALYPDLLDPSEVLFQPEGDLGAAVANYVLHHLTGSPTMMLEFWFWDEAKNQVVGGHGGMLNPALAAPGQAWISSDPTFCRPDESEGAQLQLLARPGRVTLFQLRFSRQGWQAVALSGVCLEGQPWVEAIPHAILRLDSPIAHFLNRLAAVGATQHWIMAYGSVLHELEAFCQMENIPLEVLSY
jgi:hypothetical protein